MYLVGNSVLIIIKIGYCSADPLGDFYHFGLLKASGGDGGSTDSKTACDKGTLGVAGYGVLVGGDVHLV